MADKVFCSECLHFYPGENIPYPFGPPAHIKERCISPSNYKDAYRDPSSVEISIPKIINKFSNCPWFESKSTSSSSSGSSSSSSSGEPSHPNHVVYYLSQVTIYDTSEELFIDGIPGNRILINRSDEVWAFNALLKAKQTGGSAGSYGSVILMRFEGMIRNINNTVQLLDIVQFIDQNYIDGDVTVTADNVHKALVFTAVGVDNKIINWSMDITLSEAI